jgi:type IV secretory pathway VirB9-like protein
VAERVVRALKPLADRPRPNLTILRNLGVAYQFAAGRDPGAKSQMIRYWRLYLATAPANAADRETITRAVRAAEAAPTASARP